MTTIAANDLPARLSDVLAALAAGEEFVVTDHGRPVARILPPDAGSPASQETADDWVSRWNAWADSHPKRDIAIDDSRDAIYAGCGE